MREVLGLFQITLGRIVKDPVYSVSQKPRRTSPEIITHSGFWLTPYLFLPLLLFSNEIAVSGTLEGKTCNNIKENFPEMNDTDIYM